MYNFSPGKRRPKMWATFVVFKETAHSKLSPNGRKFAQSGHPAFEHETIS
jgi:hypothetical protein